MYYCRKMDVHLSSCNFVLGLAIFSRNYKPIVVVCHLLRAEQRVGAVQCSAVLISAL